MTAKINMKRLAGIFIGIFFMLPVKGENLRELLEQANEAYINGEYSFAIELYEQVLENQKEAAELYHNLGNAYFKENRLGPAILNYKRALRLSPSDENIRFNLEVARSRIVDRIEPVPLIFYERWWKNFINLQAVDGWAVIGLAFLLLFLGSLSMYFFSRRVGIKKLGFSLSLVFLLTTGLCFFAANRQYRHHYVEKEAIVFVPRVTAKSAPGQTSTDIFVIHEGTHVRITDNLGEWYQVKLANGNVGWINQKALEVI